jgi:hypothetical protein
MGISKENHQSLAEDWWKQKLIAVRKKSVLV